MPVDVLPTCEVGVLVQVDGGVVKDVWVAGEAKRARLRCWCCHPFLASVLKSLTMKMTNIETKHMYTVFFVIIRENYQFCACLAEKPQDFDSLYTEATLRLHHSHHTHCGDLA